MWFQWDYDDLESVQLDDEPHDDLDLIPPITSTQPSALDQIQHLIRNILDEHLNMDFKYNASKLTKNPKDSVSKYMVLLNREGMSSVEDLTQTEPYYSPNHLDKPVSGSSSVFWFRQNSADAEISETESAIGSELAD